MTSLFCSLTCIPLPASMYEISDSSNTNVNKSLSPSLFYKNNKNKPVLIVFKLSWWMNFKLVLCFLFIYIFCFFFRYSKQTYFVYLSFSSNTLHTRTQFICIFYFICWRQRWYKKFRLKQTVWPAYSINLCICYAIQLTRFNSIY